MKALVRFDTKPEKLEFQEVPKPVSDETHAVLKVEAVGVCGRDLENFRQEMAAKKVPYILGHEFSGTIVDLPEGTNFKIGDRVTAETVDSVCGSCEVCRQGSYNLCKKRKNTRFALFWVKIIQKTKQKRSPKK